MFLFFVVWYKIIYYWFDTGWCLVFSCWYVVSSVFILSLFIYDQKRMMTLYKVIYNDRSLVLLTKTLFFCLTLFETWWLLHLLTFSWAPVFLTHPFVPLLFFISRRYKVETLEPGLSINISSMATNYATLIRQSLQHILLKDERFRASVLYHSHHVDEKGKNNDNPSSSSSRRSSGEKETNIMMILRVTARTRRNISLLPNNRPLLLCK